jgi:hypothetical protein
MSTATITRVIEEPRPEKIRQGDHITLRRIGPSGWAGVEVRGTVHRWDPVYADWLTLKGWPNRRFHIDGERPEWSVARITREEAVHSVLVPFTTGSATVYGSSPNPEGIRMHGIFMAGIFYPLDHHGRAMPRGPWTDFVADPS